MSELPYKKYAFLQLGHPFQRVMWWLIWSTLMLPGMFVFRWRPGAHRKVPRAKPFLLLANHTSFFDPVWISYWLGRRSAFMGSEVIFAKPFLRWLLPLAGCFPKAFATKDKSAMINLTTRYKAGEPVIIFPEGARSYDGRPLPVLEGIGRTVKRMNANVVVARIKTGHLFHPRWAKYPRWVRVVVEHETLPTFTDETSAAEISELIREKMKIDPNIEAPGLSFGFRMAHGLPRYLWACPDCFAFRSLEVHGFGGNSVRCSVCEQSWRLDTNNRMKGSSHDKTWRVSEACDRVIAFYGETPVGDQRRFLEEGVALSQDNVTLKLLRRGEKPAVFAEGTLVLCSEGLTIKSNSKTIWEGNFADISRVGIAFGDMLTLRVHDKLFGFKLKGGQNLGWYHFLTCWYEHSKAKRAP